MSTIYEATGNGRYLFSADQRGALLEAYDRSSMSGREFAQHHGVKESTFTYWLWKRQKKKTPPSADPKSYPLVEVSVAPPKSSGLEVILPSGAKVQVNEEHQIPLLKTLLKELSC